MCGAPKNDMITYSHDHHRCSNADVKIYIKRRNKSIRLKE